MDAISKFPPFCAVEYWSSFTVYLKVEDWNTWTPELENKHLVLHSHLKVPYYDLKISLFCICKEANFCL